MVNRAFETAYNRKRIRRLMEINDWNLPRPGRRRTGRAHTGRIVRGSSNERWSSDTLQIPCGNGDLVELGLILDCHDREAIAHVAVPRKYRASDVQELLQAAVTQRFGDSRPVEQIQFLSDHGSIYTALDTVCTAERLGLSPVTTPAYSPQSNRMSKAFVNTLRRDYLAGADRSTAAAVLDQIPHWIGDYNGVAPHSALGYRAPVEYRQLLQNQRGGRAANVAGPKERTVRS